MSVFPDLLATIKAHAEQRLGESGLWENPYFAMLEDGRFSREQFHASQRQFGFAVDFFSRPMAVLMARLPDYASRVRLLRNVVEEHGDFRLAQAHATTFARFLQRLRGCRSDGEDGNDERDQEEMGAAVHAFNSVLSAACQLDELEVGLGCLGVIEYAFARISARLGTGVIQRGWVSAADLVHYGLHAELDQAHADDFFALLIPAWNEPAKRRSAERGLALGAYSFDRLYRDLARL